MNSSDRNRIVHILLTDPILVQNRIRFSNSLRLSFPELQQWENRYNNGSVTPYEYFSVIISQWMSKQGSQATVQNLCEILHENNFNRLADTLKNDFSIDTETTSKKICFEVRQVTPNFVGRLKELQELEGMFLRETFVVTIIGMGGVGKSELVKKFTLQQYIGPGRNVHCVWLNGENKESLQNSVSRLAKMIAVPTTENNQLRQTVNIFTDAINKLIGKSSAAKQMIVVIDNVDEANEDVIELLSKIDQADSFAIVTSRNVGVLNFAGDLISLDVLEDEDAKLLVRTAFPLQAEKNIIKLCEQMRNFPLALQQAIAFIKMQMRRGLKGPSYTIRDYIKDLKEQKSKLLDFPLNRIEHDYRETTLVTWNVSLERIRGYENAGQTAIELLNMMAYFDPDGIELQFLQRFKKVDVETAVELMKTYSLVKVEDSVITMHRLVQEVTRLKNVLAESEIGILTNVLSSVYDIEDSLKQSDVTHILSVWRHTLNYNQLISKFDRFPYQFSCKLRDLSRYKDMLDFAIFNQEKLKQVMGEEHLETLKMESQVARAFNNNGKYIDSLKKHLQIHKKQNEILGETHESTLETGHYMAGVLENLGKHGEALKLYQTVLQSKTQVHGDDHPLTMFTKHGLASVLMNQERYMEAMEVYQKVLNWQTIQFGEDHPDTLTTKHNIGWCMYRQNEFQQAKEILDSVMELKVKTLGKEHSSTLLTKYCSAEILHKLGESETALEILREVAALREKVLGKDHPDTVQTRNAIEMITIDQLMVSF